MDEVRKETLRSLIKAYKTAVAAKEAAPPVYNPVLYERCEEQRAVLYDALNEDAVVYQGTFYACGNSMEYETDVVEIAVTLLD